jgi:DNA-directed RNA polymerase subunit RPC12/RpoP
MGLDRTKPSRRQGSGVRCPCCTSRLIYAVDGAERDGDASGHRLDRTLRLVGVALLDRRCPDCEYRDSIAMTSLAEAVRYRRDSLSIAALTALAESLASAVEESERAPVTTSSALRSHACS